MTSIFNLASCIILLPARLPIRLFKAYLSKPRGESSMSYTELTFVQSFYSLQSPFLCPHDASESLAATLQRRKAGSRGDLPKIASSNQQGDRALDRVMCTQDTSALALVNERLAFTSWLSDREEGALYLCSFFFTYTRDSICYRIQLDFI